MPKERISDIVEIVDLIAIVLRFQSFFVGSLDNICREDSPFEVNCVGDIYLTVVDEVVSPLEVLDGLSEKRNVETAFGKVVFVSSFFAPVSSIEIGGNFLASDDADIFRKQSVHHLAVLNWSFGFRWFRPEVQSYYITHC